jgi:ABC-type antimicrobial peptide transport system permease subunit
MALPVAYSYNNLLARKVTTALGAGGIALVVLIFMAVLMLAHGLETTLKSTGSPENAIILRSGANAELVSSVDREAAAIIKTQAEVATGPDGSPIAGSEMNVIVNIPRRRDGQPSNVLVRGVAPESVQMRPIEIVEGRMWRPGLSEVIAGSLISEKYRGCGIGESVKMGGREWTVVGIFEAGGTGFESEIWGDVEQVMAAINRSTFSSVTVRLKDPSTLGALKERLESDKRLNVQVKSELEFYEEQSAQTAAFIYFMGLFITVVFSIAAILAAMLTMLATISHRTAEIGTLRALGYPRRSILMAFVLESTLLGLAGGVAGVLPGFFLTQVSFSTTNWVSFSEVAWKLSLSPRIVLWSFVFAGIMGLLGGLLPAFRASRIPITDALANA